MKQITNLFLLLFCLCLNAVVMAQPDKKPKNESPTPSMSDIQKMMKELPPAQQAMVKNAMGNINATQNDPINAELDRLNKLEKERMDAIGTVTTKTIGAAGGIIKTANGKITLNIPSGALSANTLIGIEEMANDAPLACGNSFKLTPDGQVFEKPVLLTLKYNDYEIEGTVPEALTISTERKGIWYGNNKTAVNAQTKTLSLPIKHFSIWGTSAFLKLEMLPGDKELARSQSINFRITSYAEEAEKKAKREKEFIKMSEEINEEFDKTEEAKKRDEELTKQEWKEYIDSLSAGDTELVPLVPLSPKTRQRHLDEMRERKKIEEQKKAESDAKDKALKQEEGLKQSEDLDVDKVDSARLMELLKKVNKFKDFKITAWRLNGEAAPVSNDMGKLISTEYGIAKYTAPWVIPLLKNRMVTISCELTHRESKAKFIFISRVILTNNGWFRLNLDGNQIIAKQAFDKKVLAPMQGKNLSEINLVSATYMDGEMTEGENTLALSFNFGFPKSLDLRIKNPHVGSNNIDSKEGIYIILGQDRLLSLVSITRKKTPNLSCEESETPKELKVNITSLNIKTGGLVEGTFSGNLYEDGTKLKDACKSSIPHHVSGSFVLSVIAGRDGMTIDTQ